MDLKMLKYSSSKCIFGSPNHIARILIKRTYNIYLGIKKFMPLNILSVNNIYHITDLNECFLKILNKWGCEKMNKKIILGLLAIFLVIVSISAVSAADVNFGKFSLTIDGEQTQNLTRDDNSGHVEIINYNTSKGNVSVMIMPHVDPNKTIESFIKDDGYKKMDPVGNFTLLETKTGSYEGVYFADDYWVAVLFDDLDSGKKILNSFKLN